MDLVLQGPPLGFSLNVEGPPTSDDLAVLWSRAHVVGLLFQLAHSKRLDQVCHCSLVELGVLRVGSIGCIGGGTVSLL